MDSCQYVICTLTFGVISFFSLPVSFNKLEFGSWNYFLSGYFICKVNFGCIVGELSLAESPTATMSFGCDCIIKPGRLQLRLLSVEGVLYMPGFLRKSTVFENKLHCGVGRGNVASSPVQLNILLVGDMGVNTERV